MKVQELIDIVQKGLQELANGHVDAFLDNLLPVMTQIVPKGKQKFGAEDLLPIIINLTLKAAESLSKTELQKVRKNINKLEALGAAGNSLSYFATVCATGLSLLDSKLLPKFVDLDHELKDEIDNILQLETIKKATPTVVSVRCKAPSFMSMVNL